MMQAGLADTLRQAGHAVAQPVEIVFPRERRTRDPVTNLGMIASMVSDEVAAVIGRGAMPLVLEGNCTQAVGPAGGVALRTGRSVRLIHRGRPGSIPPTGTDVVGKPIELRSPVFAAIVRSAIRSRSVEGVSMTAQSDTSATASDATQDTTPAV
jgi:hypothetical protein